MGLRPSRASSDALLSATVDAQRRSTDADAAETYVTVSDRRYFVGTVALLNSLRLTGNDGQVLVIDGGLTAGQRALLEPHVYVIRLRLEDRGTHPFMKKALVRHYGAAGVLVFVDGDIVVTGRLDEPIAHARAGRVFAFPDHRSDQDRFFPEWHSIFGLRSPLRRQPYVNAGFFAFSTEHHPSLLQRLEETARAIDPSTILDDHHEHPTWAGDQEALNALMMSEVPADRVAIGRDGQNLYWDDVTQSLVDDPASLRVRYNDGPVLLLHHALSPNVWEWRAWRRVREDDVYVQLMPRLLYAEDLTIRLRGNGRPAWIAPGRPRKGRVARDRRCQHARRDRQASRHGRRPPTARANRRQGADRLGSARRRTTRTSTSFESPCGFAALSER